MDRQIVYPGQILPETALLQMAKDAMIGSAKLAAAVLGTSTIANGFAVTPTGPASLQVAVAPGEIYALTNIDSLAFSTLPADTTHSILKQGTLLDGVTLSCAAPTTTGQSINYLVQVTYQDQDSTPVLLPYYNSANPAMPFSGMGNNGQTQNTARKGVAIVQVKAGASATTGAQATPAPDSGYAGLYVVTVAYGQTTITSTSISQYSGAPLLPSGILQSIQSGATTYAQDMGTVNVYTASFTPAIQSLKDGMTLRFKAGTANTSQCTFAPTGMTQLPVLSMSNLPLAGGEILVNSICSVVYSATLGSWLLQYSTGTGFMPIGAGGLMTMLPALSGKIIDLTANQFFTIGAATTDKPSAITYGVGMHLKYPDQKYAFDLASGTTVEWFGVRQVSSDGSGSWRKLYTSADFDPANKADKATTLAGYTIAIASQVDAEGGTDNALPMTPLRVFQAIAKVVTQATETAFGWAKVATQAMVNAGTDDAAYVTSKKIRGGFIFSFAANGYIFLPAWMGGFGMQWGVSPTILSGTPLTQSLPIAFPVANLWCIAGGSDASTGQAYACNALPLTTSTIRLAQAYGTTIAARYFAIGY